MTRGINVVIITENEYAPYGQNITAGRHTFTADEPKMAGGQDSGPSPYDYLMAGLGACTAMRLRSYVRQHNWTLRRAIIELRHETINAGPNAKIDQFRRFIYLDGDLTETQRFELLKAADHCPVSETLRNSSIIETRLAPSSRSEPALSGVGAG